MNLEQVKEHFKYAKEVRCLATKIIRNVKDLGKLGIYSNTGTIWASLKDGNYIKLYNPDTNQLAEILTYIFDRGEEVEVSNDSITWFKNLFIGFTKSNEIVSEYENDNGIGCYKFVRKLTPESLLEPELTAFKKKAKEMNCTVTVIFENK